MTDLPAVPDVRTAPAEPLNGVAAVTAAAIAVIELVVSFGLPINSNQQSAILGVIAVLAPVATVVWGRLKVYSPKTVAQLIAAHRTTPTPPTPIV